MNERTLEIAVAAIRDAAIDWDAAASTFAGVNLRFSDAPRYPASMIRARREQAQALRELADRLERHGRV